MALRKYKSSNDASSLSMAPLIFLKKTHEKPQFIEPDISSNPPVQDNVDIDLREVYFLIMHFLSGGPCHRTYGQFWNELLEHELLPRRYHAWYSRSGARSGDEDDNGLSCPLSYNKLVERYSHIQKDHLVKLLKQLIMNSAPPLHGMVGGNTPNAADVPTLLGSGSFSLLGSDRIREDQKATRLPGYLRWPHMQADQVRGLSLREIGGGFSKHHRAPSIRAACYAIAKPSTMVQKMQIIKKLRGHQNAVYCAIFDRSGRYVITGSDDRLVKIWSMETAFCLSSCRGHEGDITDLAVSSNNALVASASNDFIIRVWRLPDGLPISVLRGHTSVVTAIAFSPRPSTVYQLLSSSDDGTCRIWDARHSQCSPRIYIPKPSDAVAGKNTDPSPSTDQQNHRILCCAYNANGTVFVTGSSDTYARVWNACKFNPEDSEQPNHEMDVLSGHENDVNYVQFSGCAVASRSSTIDSSNEENIPKFKNSWFTHDNIVTCSRDGSAIIWIPRSRRSHGKVGRWTRAYHLKVPPPPMPPQPPRGGPRQRFLPTPRGVNMIVWSLDNRFVLAAIMDCRICVWNAVDGSLVHSLTGHSESTYVLDVHPFNPRIAMSAGYDGKTIVWDIWEGTPVRIYETGRFKLVDGKFSPDGTSIVLSDEVGQVYILATGQGESQKDAKYDQFFLGDYRPLVQDTHGNVLDQETQLVPYRRNIQDLLCDSSMIPYPEPYQNMYQKRRLGALGIEWHPSSVKLAVGSADNIHVSIHPMMPYVDMDRWIEPLPEFLDAVDLDQENEVQSDDNDSEYNVTEEYSSEGEHGNLSNSSGDPECSAEDSEVEHSNEEGLRRSKRKKHKAEVEFMTSSGRRVKRRNLDERDSNLSGSNRKRKSRNGRSVPRRKSSKSKALRPQRVAARNAINLFSQINGGSTDDEEEEEEEEEEEDEEGSENDSSDYESMPDSNIQSNESNISMPNDLQKQSREQEVTLDESKNTVKPPEVPESQTSTGSRRRLVLKLPVRDSKKLIAPETTRLECRNQVNTMRVSSEAFSEATNAFSEATNFNRNYSSSQELVPSSGDTANAMSFQECGGSKFQEKGKAVKTDDQPDWSAGYKDKKIRWGEVKVRTSKRSRLEDDLETDGWPDSNVRVGDHTESGSNVNGHRISVEEYGMASPHSEDGTHKDVPERTVYEDVLRSRAGTSEGLYGAKNKGLDPYPASNGCHIDKENKDQTETSDCVDFDESLERADMVTDNKITSIFSSKSSIGHFQEVEGNSQPISQKLRIKPKIIFKEPRSPSSKMNSVRAPEWRSSGGDSLSKIPLKTEDDLTPGAPDEDHSNRGPSPDHGDWNNGKSGTLKAHIDRSSKRSILQDSKKLYLDSNDKMYSSVRRRSKSHRDTMNLECDSFYMEEGTSTSMTDDVRRTRSMGMNATTREKNPMIINFKVRERNGSEETSKNAANLASNGLLSDEWKSSSKLTVRLRSARNKGGNYFTRDRSLLDKRKTHHSIGRLSWLMLSEHEESYRYIPQQGDEVAYLRQGHQEYIDLSCSQELGPWRLIKGTLRAVEFCKVASLDYSTLPGSGESCCKISLEFIDPSSGVFGNIFKLTLPELIDFPDFLVERTRYDAGIKRNWAPRDKCLVWWRNENEEGGSWWDGRILGVKPKSPEFPESPWERYVIQYKSDSSSQHLHSPWELHDSDSPWEHPHIDDWNKQKLLSCFAKLEENSNRNQDYYGIQKLEQITQKSDFLNRFPAPLSLEVIKRRLENNYYRSLEAVKHDTTVMMSNAQSYFGKSAEFTTKMRRLSDSITRTLSSM